MAETATPQSAVPTAATSDKHAEKDQGAPKAAEEQVTKQNDDANQLAPAQAALKQSKANRAAITEEVVETPLLKLLDISSTTPLPAGRGVFAHWKADDRFYFATVVSQAKASCKVIK